MAIVIKGMKMPKNCNGCNFMCCLRHFNILNDDRPSDCPIIAELPEKYGRLVDADKIKATYGEWYIEEGPEEGFIGTVGNLIDLIPTVIEAEGD